MSKLLRSLAFLATLSSASFTLDAAEDFGSAAPFKTGDTVCFVGDSITHGGSYHSIVLLYYATRFPDRAIQAFNCGIGGDRASGIMSDEKFRLNKDILGHRPTVATIMLGMNDVGHADYSAAGKDAPDAAQKRERSLEVYDESMQKLIGALQKGGARIILLTPSIYDETTKLESARKDIGVGVNDALGKCAGKVHDWAKKYGAGIVNFYEVMNALNQREQARNPAFTIVGPDRVHPGPVGHFVMAYAFLKAQGLPREVSTIGVDAKKGKAAGASNCTITAVKTSGAKLEFDCTEKSLPVVVPDDAKEALNLVPFTKELNEEKLVVSGLAPGTYDLNIDGQPIGEYPATDLQAGINLSENPKTPQYQQSSNATKISKVRTAIGSQLRSLAAQIYSLSKANVDVSSDAAIEKALTSRLQDSQKDGKAADARLKSALDSFKIREKLNHDYDALAVAMRESCQPRLHHFTLTKK
jgi:endoglucanase